jgi:hypothetical protein
MSQFIFGFFIAALMVACIDTRFHVWLSNVLERPAPQWWRKLISR